ncbi:MAG: response regulator [Thermodesulfovibrionales bacterium]
MNDKDKRERRKCDRHHFRGDIVIDDTVKCTTSDISQDGLYVCMMQPLEKNKMIRVTIPFKGNKIIVKAQVRSSDPSIGMGIVFIDLNAEQRGKIKELIESITKKPAQSESEGKNILLVEDNNTTRQAIKSALCKEGFSVIEAMDGIEAMKFIAEQNIDLIILDLYMKGMDGLKVLSVLKTNPKWKELPVIVCSGHDAQDVKEKVMNAGADEFLSKRGTSPAKLAQSAKALLQQRHKT